ncbi:MAG: hypothetical protein BJ554DRAFT_5796 [Olpidium bornovanus]|uniref:Uncharacterized protein n=1 Tax=Olpidium bornovanus TaxID=278681 RepID=A0A8H7ZYY0_9FUNG|nr:MAG: hypothetical protein BJ554DRAFT_5796 [Olpidium bornovanus]
MAQALNTRRLTKELRDLHENPPERVTVAEAEDLKTYVDGRGWGRKESLELEIAASSSRPHVWNGLKAARIP